MKTYLLITKIIYSKKQILKSILSFFCVIFVLGYIMTSFAEMYADYSYYVLPYKNAQYDVVLSDLTQEELENQFTMNNINKYVTMSSSTINPSFRSDNNTFFIHEDLTATKVISSKNDLNEIVDFIFKDSLLSIDKKNLNMDNAIIISDQLAFQLEANIGDLVYINCWSSVSEKDDGSFVYEFENNYEYEFVVGAIYKDNLMISSSALISDYNMRSIISDNYNDRYDDEQQKVWVNNMYSEIFIEFSDKSLGKEETYKYIPIEKSLYYRYGEEWKFNFDENMIHVSYQDYVDDMLKNNNLYYTMKDSLIIKVERDSLLNTKTILFNFVIIFSAVTFIYIGKFYKQIKLIKKSIGIFVSEGMPIRKIFIYFFFTSLVEQLLSLGILLFLQLIMFKIYPTPINAEVLNMFVVKSTYFPLALSALLSSFVVSIFAVKNLSRKELLKAISENC